MNNLKIIYLDDQKKKNISCVHILLSSLNQSAASD